MKSRKFGAVNPIDRHVGRRARLRRLQLGMSQAEVARRIGVTFQAIQKYEAGGVRISASRLYGMACALQVSPAFFFAGYGAAMRRLVLEEPDRADDIAALVRGYCALRDAPLRAEVLRLIEALGALPGGAPAD